MIKYIYSVYIGVFLKKSFTLSVSLSLTNVPYLSFRKNIDIFTSNLVTLYLTSSNEIIIYVVCFCPLYAVISVTNGLYMIE